MRARTVFIVLLIGSALIPFGPALIAVVSQTIAEGFGCQPAGLVLFALWAIAPTIVFFGWLGGRRGKAS